MSTKIKLVQGDTRPQILITVRDENNLAQSIAGATVKMRFADAGTLAVLTTLEGDLQAGLADADGNVNAAAPYDVPGSGGRVVFSWTPGALDVPEGAYLGEVEVTYADGGVQTINDMLRFSVRAQL